MNRIASRLLAAAAILSLPAALSAHRMWLLPSGTVFSQVGNWVTVDAAVSNDLFYADHQPGRLDTIKVWQPDGSPGRIQNGSTGRYRSVFDVELDKPGTWKIGSDTMMVTGSFKVDGVERRVGGRGGPGGAGQRPAGEGPRPAGQAGQGGPGAEGGPPRLPPVAVADIPANATDVKLTQVGMRNEIFVTAGEPTTAVFAPTGHGLELVPITHPDELVAGEPARFRFVIDGKPAAGLTVTVIPGGKRYRNAERAMTLMTGADGVLTVKWPGAGMYWLNATATDARPTAPRATDRRMSYSATLEVMGA